MEELLNHAVIVFRGANIDSEHIAKGKAVRKLAEKLLPARLKFLKARIYDKQPVIEKNVEKSRRLVEKLCEQEFEIRLGGVNAILIEFGVKDLIE